MHVLHAAVVEVAAGVEAEHRLHLSVPEAGDVLALDLALDERLLDLVAQDHVQRIGAFVRGNADAVGGLHAREQAVEVAGLERGLVAVRLPEHRREQSHERG